MAKRFTDTCKWDKGSFMSLHPKMKLAWGYLCDKCDHAGVWDINIQLLSIQIGFQYTTQEIIDGLGDRVRPISQSKLLLTEFVGFQYGELNPDNKVHRSVIQRLENVGATKPLDSPIQGAKDKDKEKEKDKEQEEGGVGETKTPRFGIAQGEVAACIDEWRTTLKYFEIDRPIGPRDELAITRAIQSFGPEWVKLAFLGARKQTKSKTFDPKHFVSLSIYLHKDRVERLVNIGAGKESIDGIDWNMVFGKQAS